MPKSDVQPPPGYRNAVVATKYNHSTTYSEKVKSKAAVTQKKKKQVSEVDSTATLKSNKGRRNESVQDE